MEHRGSDCYRASAALCSIRLEVAENLHGGTFGSENQLATQTLPMRPVVETQESRQKLTIWDADSSTVHGVYRPHTALQSQCLALTLPNSDVA